MIRTERAPPSDSTRLDMEAWKYTAHARARTHTHTPEATTTMGGAAPQPSLSAMHVYQESEAVLGAHISGNCRGVGSRAPGAATGIPRSAAYAFRNRSMSDLVSCMMDCACSTLRLLRKAGLAGVCTGVRVLGTRR